MTTLEFNQRKQTLHGLAEAMERSAFQNAFLRAYGEETQFVLKDIFAREIAAPIALLRKNREEEALLIGRNSLSKVAVMMPKNGLGLTLVKAVASAYLMGNEVVVYFPSALKKTAEIYRDLMVPLLTGVTLAERGQSGVSFLHACFHDPEIQAVVIYGDDAWIEAYRPLAEKTGTKFIFEGPGNDPLVVMPDADLDAAVEGCIAGGLNNGGQSCSALERFFVHESVYAEFSKRLIRRVHSLTLGDPQSAKTDIGPLVSDVVRARISAQVAAAKAAGATLELGGGEVLEPRTGLTIVEPTVLTGCRVDMDVVARETFGPVFPLVSFSGTEDLIAMIDQAEYGLNAAHYGTAPEGLVDHLNATHRNVYANSHAASACNLGSRLMDGGFRRSALIWDFNADEPVRSGRRHLTVELSRAA